MKPILVKRILILGMLSIWRHRLRSSLTILGIVFGVCSVIAMLAIGEGASYEAQEQIRKLGSQNVIINSIKPPQSETVGEENQDILDYGLRYKDAVRIRDTLKSVEVLVPARNVRCDVSYERRRAEANAIGTVPWHPEIAKQAVRFGRYFNDLEMKHQRTVCVLSHELSQRFFPYTNPLGKVLKVKTDYYRVIGVMEPVGAVGAKTEGAGTYNLYMPLTASQGRFGDVLSSRSSGSSSSERVELHQIIVRFKKIEAVVPAAEIIRQLLDRFHKQPDFEIVVPLELLKQAARTKRIFNIVLGSIAAISLLVGGIGIMNIMLASVTERTREIGIRRALGAKQRDIIAQFLTETVLLSACGGGIGLLLGILIPFLITHFAEMKTIIRLWSLGGAFGISIAIGIVFGIYPAYRAAMMDPISALRHE